MRDQQRIARVGNAARRRPQQAQLAVDFGQQHHPSVAGHATAIEAALDLASTQSAKINYADLIGG